MTLHFPLYHAYLPLVNMESIIDHSKEAMCKYSIINCTLTYNVFLANMDMMQKVSINDVVFSIGHLHA